MYDKRVVRGSTYAMPVIPHVRTPRAPRATGTPRRAASRTCAAPARAARPLLADTPPPPTLPRPRSSPASLAPAQSQAMEIDRDAKDKLARSQRSMQATRLAEEQDRAARARTPPAVPGRRHAEANTEVFLEVLSDRAPEEEAGVQTDAHLDRPPEPIFVPQPVRTSRVRARTRTTRTPECAPSDRPAAPPRPAALLSPFPPRSLAWTRRRRSRRATSSTLTSR